MAKATGQIIQIQGGVVDVEFPADGLPDIFDALEIPVEGDLPMILEVQKHLGKNWVRTVAMDTTDGLQRGMNVYSTGSPIMVPVGEPTLGRVFNVLGRPVDAKEPVIADIYKKFPLPDHLAAIRQKGSESL